MACKSLGAGLSAKDSVIQSQHDEALFACRGSADPATSAAISEFLIAATRRPAGDFFKFSSHRRRAAFAQPVSSRNTLSLPTRLRSALSVGGGLVKLKALKAVFNHSRALRKSSCPLSSWIVAPAPGGLARAGLSWL